MSDYIVSPTILTALLQGTAILKQKGIANATFDSESLLAHILGLSRFDLAINKTLPLTFENYKSYLSLIKKRAERYPLQYILQVQYFMGRPFYVDENVLIPRGETELLCEQVIHYAKSLPIDRPKVLDLCTGSGALAVSLSLAFPNATVFACDISSGALAVAQKNAIALNAKVDFYQGDFLTAVNNHRFDVIVSNPPYITAPSLPQLQAEVHHEPALALDGGEDGLVFYRKLAKEGKKYLTPQGRIFCEIGHDQSLSVPSLFKANGFSNTILLKDLQQIDRMVIAY